MIPANKVTVRILCDTMNMTPFFLDILAIPRNERRAHNKQRAHTQAKGKRAAPVLYSMERGGVVNELESILYWITETTSKRGLVHFTIMPSLVLTGHPSCGKTTLAHLIRKRALQLDSIQRVEIINEESNCPDHSKSACYLNSHIEKKTRAALKSAFDRVVSANEPGVLVILDSLNYIKGFRYELHCISKAANELHGIVWVLNDVEACKEWNKGRDSKSSFTEEQMKELILRYEPPDARNRWDHPLYRIDVRSQQQPATGSSAKDALQRSVYNMHKLSDAIDSDGAAPIPVEATAQTTVQVAETKKPTPVKRSAFKRRSAAPKSNQSSDETVPESVPSDSSPSTTLEKTSATAKEPEKQRSLEELVDEFLQAFLSRKPLAQGLSTRQHVAADADCLHTVDGVTHRICNSLAASQNQSAATVISHYQVEFSSLSDEKLSWTAPPNQRISLTILKRIRRQYIAWIQTHPPEDSSERGIAISFLEYIAQALDNGH